ncbi:TolC family protein [Phaeodactylibacter sp.]|uniref:TolC family protein n=1 Tax=Phaeodactylibacter sp. TaxID=1940289 RepID=UPI0025E10811|nr:TolC family protein [Phaeodactylibacter sp.]MCI4647062.1 TolC family protein [Phaeodactylibacter sp.]MCI5090044.1 TolC family protein [Phaeodactylibacter sp.]
MKIRIHSTVMMLLLALPLLAQQQAVQMSLDDAIDYALENSLTIKDAQIAIADAEEQIVERRSSGLPQVNGSLNYQHYLAVPRQPLPEGFDIFGLFGQVLAVDLYDQLSNQTQMAVDESFSGNGGGGGDEGIAFFLRNNFTAGIDVNAMIFDGSFFVALKAARAYRQYTLRDFATTQREVENAVIEAYLPVLLVQENIELLEKNIKNLEQLLFETRELYKAGFAEQLDLDRQELSLSNLRIERENLVRQKEVSLTNLKYTIGFPIDQPLVVSDDLDAMTIEAEALLSEEASPASRPEVALIDQAIRMNELNIKLNQAGYLPSLNAFGAVQQQYQGDDFQSGFWAPSAYVGLSMSVPIFDGLNKKAKIQRARLDLEKARNQREELVRGISLEVANAQTNFRNASSRLNSQQKNLDLAERIYETAQVKYREGVGSSLEVTQAEQSLYTTQSNYMQALYDVLQSKARLEMALGK